MSNETALSLSENNFFASCDDLRLWVGLENQAVNELIPGARLSDLAAKIHLDSLEAIALQVGRERFHEIVLKIIDTCDRRPTIATYRKLAGLNTRLGPQEEALAKAWEICTVVVTRFLAYDGEGNVSVRPRIAQRDGSYFEEHPPHLPNGIKVAVQSLGGWKALAESYPAYWTHKFSAFKEVYVPSPEEQSSLLAVGKKQLATTESLSKRS